MNCKSMTLYNEESKEIEEAGFTSKNFYRKFFLEGRKYTFLKVESYGTFATHEIHVYDGYVYTWLLWDKVKDHFEWS